MARPARRQRKRLRIGRRFGRLCDDCMKDLVRHPSSTARTSTGQERSRTETNRRHVA